MDQPLVEPFGLRYLLRFVRVDHNADVKIPVSPGSNGLAEPELPDAVPGGGARRTPERRSGRLRAHSFYQDRCLSLWTDNRGRTDRSGVFPFWPLLLPYLPFSPCPFDVPLRPLLPGFRRCGWKVAENLWPIVLL